MDPFKIKGGLKFTFDIIHKEGAYYQSIIQNQMYEDFDWTDIEEVQDKHLKLGPTEVLDCILDLAAGDVNMEDISRLFIEQ